MPDSLTTPAFDVALDTAVTATRGLRPALHALEEIASMTGGEAALEAPEPAVQGLREVKDAIIHQPGDEYARELSRAMDRVSLPTFDAALGEGRI